MSNFVIRKMTVIEITVFFVFHCTYTDGDDQPVGYCAASCGTAARNKGLAPICYSRWTLRSYTQNV